MAPSFLLGCALVALVPFAKASRLIIRQAARDDIDLYIKEVRSALKAIDGIRDNNASEACADTTYASRLDEQGLDGQLAQILLCEEAAGIRIFPNIDQAKLIFRAAYTGLTAGSSPPFGPNGKQSFSCEGDGSEETTYLDNAGLDGPSIRDIVCPDSSLPPLATSTLQTRSDLVSIAITQSATSSRPSTASLGATSEGQSGSATASSSSSSTAPASRSSSGSIQLLSSTSRTSSTTSQASSSTDPSPSPQSLPPTSSTRTRSSSRTRPQPPSSPSSAQSAPTTPPSASATPDPPVIIVTTFVTVTLSDKPNVSTPLPPLRFTLRSRVVPTEDPTMGEETDLPAWTLGPPLSFAHRPSQSSQYPESLPKLKFENGTSLTVICSSS